MVAALMVSRQGPARSSAALRKTAARSVQAMFIQSARAFMQASIAICTSFSPQLCTCASTSSWLWGEQTCSMLPVRTSLPPMKAGMSIGLLLISASFFCSRALSGLPGAYPNTGSLAGWGIMSAVLFMLYLLLQCLLAMRTRALKTEDPIYDVSRFSEQNGSFFTFFPCSDGGRWI